MTTLHWSSFIKSIKPIQYSPLFQKDLLMMFLMSILMFLLFPIAFKSDIIVVYPVLPHVFGVMFLYIYINTRLDLYNLLLEIFCKLEIIVYPKNAP